MSVCKSFFQYGPLSLSAVKVLTYLTMPIDPASENKMMQVSCPHLCCLQCIHATHACHCTQFLCTEQVYCPLPGTAIRHTCDAAQVISTSVIASRQSGTYPTPGALCRLCHRVSASTGRLHAACQRGFHGERCHGGHCGLSCRAPQQTPSHD